MYERIAWNPWQQIILMRIMSVSSLQKKQMWFISTFSRTVNPGMNGSLQLVFPVAPPTVGVAQQTIWKKSDWVSISRS